MSDQRFGFHEESAASVHAPVNVVFAYLDDPKASTTHMRQSSIMMPGSHMEIEVDADGGQSVGSIIRMRGSMMGMSLSFEEVITTRRVPYEKTWETIGTPNLKVMAHYRMRFELTPQGESTKARVCIDYRLPATAPGAWVGRLFGGMYARWCVKHMVSDAVKHFCQTSNESTRKRRVPRA